MSIIGRFKALEASLLYFFGELATAFLLADTYLLPAILSH